MHSPRAARHTRTVHRILDRALRRELSALARARTSARDHPRRGRAAGRLRQSDRAELREHHVRSENDPSNDPIKGKIATAEEAKVHTMLVIGGRDMEAGP